ncbi:MAG: AmmeMemoRadiSam system protein B [bacterium]|nr:AmmeMemoRadiSam system protein B [candidate division KSB1 bacterium]MDH7560539.1 AmmeMemoRadiSam system protein B [bacterium]
MKKGSPRLSRQTWRALCVFIVVGVWALLLQSDVAAQVRPPAVAGAWYSDDPTTLRATIQKWLDQAQDAGVEGEIYGLLAPHAGYEYSGATAAVSYRQVRGRQYDAVVIIGPSHREYFAGVSVFNGEGYRTPLGVAAVDKELAAAIAEADPLISLGEAGHRGAEHSIEAQVPFLQVALPGTKIVPIAMLDDSWDTCRRVGAAIAGAAAGRKVLIVASSDLYHGESYAACNASDAQTLAQVEGIDPQAFCKGARAGKYAACGAGPIAAMQCAAQLLGATQAKVLAHTTSGDVTGQKTGYVVGYGAAVVFGPPRQQKKAEAKATMPGRVEFSPLSAEVQQELLRMARQSIAHYLEHGTIPEFTPPHEVMKERRGVFVTITKRGELRGCIGHHESDVPLYKLVPQMAVASAFQDPRFPPLRKDELGVIRIKVSVYLTNVYRIDNLDQFVMGKHGIIMYKDGRGATFLPEVPLEAGWKTKEEELRSLCQKAGLPPDAWKQGAVFYLYETQVFEEGK